MRLGQNIGSVYSEGKEIQRVYSQGKLVWEKEKIDYNITPFTVKAIDDNVSINLNTSSSSNVVSVKYSINDTEWVQTDNKTTINISKNDRVSVITSDIVRCVIKGLSDVYGNIMSLKYGDNFIGQTVWTKGNSLSYGFFQLCNIRSAKNLILPATNLANYAYARMFENSSTLISAPALPATTLSPYCYNRMFAGCSSLTKAPTLPATNLAEGCYMEMFAGELSGAGVIDPNNNRSGLIKAPELPATNLAEACYYGMFVGCQNLTSAPTLPATTLKDSCYFNMFAGCSSLTKAPTLPANKLADRCYAYMFYECVNLTSAPELPATTLQNGCYGYMFSRCSALTKAPELPATTLQNGCYACMFSYCSKLNYIKCYATKVQSGVSLVNTLGELVIGLDSNYWVYWATDTAASGKLVCKSSFASSLKQYIPSTWTVEYLN